MMQSNWLAEDGNAARVEAQLQLRPAYRSVVSPPTEGATPEQVEAWRKTRDFKYAQLARLMMAEEELEAEEKEVALASAALREAREARLKLEAEVAEREAMAPSSPDMDDSSSDDEAEEAAPEKPASKFRLGLNAVRDLTKRQRTGAAATPEQLAEKLAAARASGLADRLARLGGLTEGAARWNKTGAWWAK